MEGHVGRDATRRAEHNRWRPRRWLKHRGHKVVQGLIKRPACKRIEQRLPGHIDEGRVHALDAGRLHASGGTAGASGRRPRGRLPHGHRLENEPHDGGEVDQEGEGGEPAVVLKLDMVAKGSRLAVEAL